MLLLHFTDIHRAGFLLLCGLLLAGCVTNPLQTGGDENRQSGSNGQPGEVREVPARVQSLYDQVVQAMDEGDTVEAELRLQEFLLQYPTYPGAYVNLAIIQNGRDDAQAAEQSLLAALTYAPEHPVALNELGMLYRRQGKFPEAEAAYMKAVTANPDYALAHYNLGVLNDLYLQRLDVAMQHYERYQEIAGEEKGVTLWIADLSRRIDAAQRTANVTE